MSMAILALAQQGKIETGFSRNVPEPRIPIRSYEPETLDYAAGGAAAAPPPASAAENKIKIVL